LALTAHAIATMVEQCTEAGMDGYLTKPVQSEKLHAAIHEFVSRPQVISDHVSPPSDVADTIDRDIWSRLLDLQKRSGGDLLIELVDAFEKQCDGLETQIHQAVSEGNAEKLRRGAHQLKGSASNLGAHQLAGLCSKLEKRGLPLSDKALETLHSAVVVAKAELQRLLGASLAT
jgi:HPt (histidine-containing phosphotransfer) domain-containing protein